MEVYYKERKEGHIPFWLHAARMARKQPAWLVPCYQRKINFWVQLTKSYCYCSILSPIKRGQINEVLRFGTAIRDCLTCTFGYLAGTSVSDSEESSDISKSFSNSLQMSKQTQELLANVVSVVCLTWLYTGSFCLAPMMYIFANNRRLSCPGFRQLIYQHPPTMSNYAFLLPRAKIKNQIIKRITLYICKRIKIKEQKIIIKMWEVLSTCVHFFFQYLRARLGGARQAPRLRRSVFCNKRGGTKWAVSSCFQMFIRIFFVPQQHRQLPLGQVLGARALTRQRCYSRWLRLLLRLI